MPSILRKIGRDISTRRVRTALVSACIFIGVLGVIALLSMGDIFIQRLEESIDPERLAMIQVYASARTDEPLDNPAVIQTLREIPDVTEVQGMARIGAYWRKSATDEFIEGRIFTYTVPFDELPLEPTVLIEGVYPQAGQQQIAIERRLSLKYDLELGDTISFRILGGETDEETWTIVGIVDQAYQYPIAPGAPIFIGGENMLFATPEDTAYITGVEGFTSFLLRMRDFPTAKARTGEIERTLSEKTPYRPITSVLDDPDANAFIVQIESFRNVVSLLAVISLLIAGFVVFNVVNAVVVEQRRQIGVLKSLGADRQDIFQIYAGTSLVYGIIGVIPGVILGIPLGYQAALALVPQFNIFLDDFRYSPTAIILGIVLGLVVPVIATLPPIASALRVTIREAMTDLGIETSYEQQRLGRLLDQMNLPVSLRQALRNVLQKRGRLTITIISLSLAAGAFMGVYAMLGNLTQLTTDIFNTFGNEITFATSTDADFEVVKRIITSEVDGLEAIEPSSSAAVQIEGYEPVGLGAAPANLFGFGINTENPDLVNFNLRSGVAWYDDPTLEGVVITNGIADALGKDAGDMLALQIGTSETELPILGVTNYPFPVVWIPWEMLSERGGISAGAPRPNQYIAHVTINDEPLPAAGLDDTVIPFINMLQGEFFGEGELIVSASLAEKYPVGSEVTLKSGENEQTFTVSGVLEVPPQLGDESAIALDWIELANLEGRSLEGGEPIPNVYSIILENKEADGEEVQDVIRNINDVLIAQNINGSFTNWVLAAEYVGDLILTSSAILNLAALLIGMVGAIGLLSTLSISVFERQKEIGVMRSIGATSQSVAIQFLVEGWIVGLIGWLFGLPISYVLNLALANAFNFGDAAGFRYPPVTILYGFVLIMLLTTLASLSPALAAARKTISDILRYQ